MLIPELFSHFTNYTSLTAFSINAAGDIKYDFISVGGDYSIEKDLIRKAEVRFSLNLISILAFKINEFVHCS